MYDSKHAVINHTSSWINTKRDQFTPLSIQHPQNSNNNNDNKEDNTSLSYMKSNRQTGIEEEETRGDAIRIPNTTTSNTRRTSSSSASASSSSSNSIIVGVGESNNDTSVGSLALRKCLDLLVRVQKNQAEGVLLITSLRQRLFPTSTVSLSHNNKDDALKPHVVTLDEVDREVVRLRVVEMKHAGLYSKLIESIQDVILPYQSFIQQEIKGESINNHMVLLQELCHRVECLREQFIGLAQLQEEAMESLGAQLSEIFTLPRGIKTLYYYPTNRLDETCNHSDSNNASEKHIIPRHDHRHITVLHFLEQLEDVMASKQHIVVCLAMTLREIYDTPSSSTSTTTINTMTPHSNINTTMMSEVTNNDYYSHQVERNERSIDAVSVSLSPVSTLRPSCSAPREGSLWRRLGEGQQSTSKQEKQKQEKEKEQELSTGEVRECVYDNLSDSHKTESIIIITGTSPLPNVQDIHTQRRESSVSSVSSTNSMNRIDEEYNKYQDKEKDKENKEENKKEEKEEKLTSEERGVSPQNGIPRSPSRRMCTIRDLSPTVVRIYDDDEDAAAPPLVRCLESTIAINSPSEDLKEKEEKEGENVEKDDNGISSHNIRNSRKSISTSPSLSLPRSSILEVESQEEEEEEKGEKKEQQEKGQKMKEIEKEMNSVDTITENTRLRRMLDAKDNLILNMQERMFAAVPLLVDRLESRSASSTNSSNSNSSTNCNSNSNYRGPSAEERSASLSTSKAVQPPPSRELEVLKESLEAQIRENNYLRSNLDILKEEKQRWKRTARELKEDNTIWRDKERAARLRCTQLEEDVIALKKRVLTLEGVLKLQENAGTIGITGTRSSALQSSSSTGVHTSLHDGPFPHTSSNSNNNHNNNNNKNKKEMNDVDIDMHNNTYGEILSPERSRSQTQPPLLKEEIPTITQTSTSLQQKRSQIFAKLAKRMNERGTSTTPTVVIHTQSPPCEDEPEVVIVSPLTEERSVAAVVQSSEHISNAETQTPPKSVSPISASRIDRRLSPEYLSPQPRLTSSSASTVHPINSDHNKSNCGETTRLSTSDVNRILASARNLLKNVSSTRKHYSGKPSTTEGGVPIDSTSSDYHTTSSDESYQATFTVRGQETIITPEKTRKPVERIRRSISPPNGVVSPCSSVSYSSAKKRAQRLRPLEKNSTIVPVVTPAEKIAQRKGILTTTTTSRRVTPSYSHSPQPNEKHMKISLSSSASLSPQTREPTTAREALMRELREQLCLLQTQHASVLSQAEQLEKKREQVIAAMQRQSRSSSNNSSSTDGSIRSSGMEKDSTNSMDMRHNLTSLLKRFDITQKKVLKNEAQLREYVDIVRKQLKTLEDDLL